MKYNSNNKPQVCMLYDNKCYKTTYKMTVRGVLWHSTGANNPQISRYVQPSPSDPKYQELLTLLGKHPYNNHWNLPDQKLGVNAFIGRLADKKTVTTIQTLPWDYAPVGAGGGKYGTCNDGWIQFEICEDALTDRTYFDAVYKEACELTAYLCKEYNLDPSSVVKYKGKDVPVILDHSTACKLGFGSNHGDVQHWFKKYGKTLDDVRKDVAKLMGSEPAAKPTTTQPATSTTTTKPTTSTVTGTITVGDVVQIKPDAKNYYGTTKTIPNWVKNPNWFVTSVSGSRVVLGKSEDGRYNIQSAFDINDLKLIKDCEAASSQCPYMVRVNIATLNYRTGPDTKYPVKGTVKKNDIYTIVEVSGDWGKLKSGAGWIYLPHTKKV